MAKLGISPNELFGFRQDGSASAQFLPAMFDQFGAEDGGGSTEWLREFMKAEQVKWVNVIEEAKFTTDG